MNSVCVCVCVFVCCFARSSAGVKCTHKQSSLRSLTFSALVVPARAPVCGSRANIFGARFSLLARGRQYRGGGRTDGQCVAGQSALGRAHSARDLGRFATSLMSDHFDFSRPSDHIHSSSATSNIQHQTPIQQRPSKQLSRPPTPPSLPYLPQHTPLHATLWKMHNAEADRS